MPIVVPRLVVGLGNPGAEYEDNRHNLGFWFIDRLAQDLKVSLAPQGKFFGHVGRLGDLWLLKPTTFMNRSGQAVVALARFYKIMPDEILVVHDELDLQPGVIRLKQGGGNGGHNGLKDIQAQLGTPNFWRLRLGIGHPGDKALVHNYVLSDFAKAERDWVEAVCDGCADLAGLLATHRLDEFQNRMHLFLEARGVGPAEKPGKKPG